MGLERASWILRVPGLQRGAGVLLFGRERRWNEGLGPVVSALVKGLSRTLLSDVTPRSRLPRRSRVSAAARIPELGNTC